MLQGAIIGLVVGIIMVAVRFYKQGKGGQAIKEALKQGGPAAREALDKYVAPSHSGKVSATKLLDHLERFGWLAILGELSKRSSRRVRSFKAGSASSRSCRRRRSPVCSPTIPTRSATSHRWTPSPIASRPKVA